MKIIFMKEMQRSLGFSYLELPRSDLHRRPKL